MTNWIETKDRLPTAKDADKGGNLLAWSVERSDWVWCIWDRVSIQRHAAWITTLPYQPTAPEYRPFTRDEFFPHADRWLKDQYDKYFRTTVIFRRGASINGVLIIWDDLFRDYTFADDGTPCGVLVDG